MTAKLEKRAATLAKTHVEDSIAAIAETLNADLPGNITARAITDGIEIKGRAVSASMAGNSSIRDVAFLLRGVR